MVFEVAGETFSAHSFVLAARSPVFGQCGALWANEGGWPGPGRRRARPRHGATCVRDFASVHDTDSLLEAIGKEGLGEEGAIYLATPAAKKTIHSGASFFLGAVQKIIHFYKRIEPVPENVFLGTDDGILKIVTIYILENTRVVHPSTISFIGRVMGLSIPKNGRQNSRPLHPSTISVFARRRCCPKIRKKKEAKVLNLIF